MNGFSHLLTEIIAIKSFRLLVALVDAKAVRQNSLTIVLKLKCFPSNSKFLLFAVNVQKYGRKNENLKTFWLPRTGRNFGLQKLCKRYGHVVLKSVVNWRISYIQGVPKYMYMLSDLYRGVTKHF